jgi:RNA polymerase sigma-70 factor (ECF subfamily)
MEDREKFFRQLISDNHERIYRICSYHSSSRADCDDLYQQVLINIWQALRTFRGEAKLSTWIYRIALNTSIDFTRSEDRRLHQRQKFELETSTHATKDDRWQKIQEEKMLEELKSQIIQLSIVEKLIMSLVMEEVTSKEIADIVGISEVNVRVKIHRIKENLKLALGGQNNG